MKAEELKEAAKTNNPQSLKQLIAEGVDVNQSLDEYGWTALHSAAQEGHVEVLQVLLSAGAAVNQPRTNYGDTPLFMAAQKGHTAVVERLLAAGAAVNQTNKDGATPLYVAAFKGHAEVVERLLAAGAAVNQARLYGGATPLYWAAQKGHAAVVERLLLAGAAVNQANKDGFTPLWTAACNGHAAVVERLLSAGAAVNQADKDGETPLYWAAQRGHAAVVERLLLAGAAVNQANKDGITPLFMAARNGHAPVVERLLVAGAVVNQANKDGATPLFMTAQNGHAAVVERLLLAGAVVNQANKDGATPLFMTAQNGHAAVVERLLLAGAAVNQANKEGITPLFMAARNGHAPVVEPLLAAGAAVNQVRTTDGATPLYVAAENGHATVVQRLLSAGAAVNQANKDGETPLHGAAFKGHAAVVERLLLAGAAVNQARPDDGATPLYTTAYLSFKNKNRRLESMAQLLLERGGDWGKQGQPKELSDELSRFINELPTTKANRFRRLVSEIQQNSPQLLEVNVAGDWLSTEQLHELTQALKKNKPIKLCFLGEQLAKARSEDRVYLLTRFPEMVVGVVEAKELALAGNIQGLSRMTQSTHPIAQVLGYSALHLAALVGQESLIAPLIDSGIDYKLKDKAGRTALQIAQAQEHKAFVQVLKRYHESDDVKRLEHEAIELQREVMAFKERQARLQNDLLALVLPDDGLGYLKLLRAFWQSYLRLVQQGMDVRSFKAPAYLLRLNEQAYSLSEKAKLKILSSTTLSESHPMFALLTQLMTDLKQQKPSYSVELQPVVECLIDAYRRYHHLVRHTPKTQRFYLYQTPAFLFGLNEAQALISSAQDTLLSQEKNKDMAGGHVVHQVGGVHFKLNPHAPGVEYMVSSLGNIIAGEGATPTEMVKVISPEGRAYIYQASHTVRGKDLETLIRFTPQHLQKIRPTNFSAMMVLSLLTDPQDGKADNYMVEFKQDGLIDIIGIDNDIAFAEPIIKEWITKEDGKEEKRYFVNVKNVLYFLPQMQHPIDPAFRAEFLKRVPELVLIEWLATLYEKNQRYQQLVTEGLFSQDELSGSAKRGKGLQLPIKLAPGTVRALYRKLQKLHEQMAGYPNLSHADLFARVQPELAKHYATVQQRHADDVIKCVRVLYEDSIEDWEELQAFRKLTAQEQSIRMTELVVKTTDKLGFERERIVPIEDSIKEFLKVLDYKRLTQAMAQPFYGALQRLSFLYQGSSLLHLAVRQNNLALANFLLSHRLVPLDALNDQGLTALEEALTQEPLSTALIHQLVVHGATLLSNSILNQRRPLIHEAVLTKNEVLLECLLEHQLMPVDSPNQEGYTALHIAASMGEVQMVKRLLQEGAHVTKQDKYQRSAHDKVAERLEKERDGTKRQALEQIQQLLQAGKGKLRKGTWLSGSRSKEASPPLARPVLFAPKQAVVGDPAAKASVPKRG